MLQVVFNCIDYGEYFDCAVASLCVSLSLPYVSASSYGHSAVAECYPSLSLPSNGEHSLYTNCAFREYVYPTLQQLCLHAIHIIIL